MESMIQPQVERDAERLQSGRKELVARIAQIVGEDGAVVPFKGLHLFRVSTARNPVHSVGDPSFCVIAQGSKEILLGNSRYHYDPAHYLITTVDLPRVSQILEASPAQPYLSLRLELDPALIGSLMMESGYASSVRGADVRAIDVSPLDANLLDAVVRLVRLMDCPSEAQGE